MSRKLFRSIFANLFPLTVSLALFAQLGQAADALQFYNNYFVTGDYVVGGVGLRNAIKTAAPNPNDPAIYVKGTISIGNVNVPNGSSPVPDNGDIVAAFLYWQTDEPASAGKPGGWRGYFNGNQIVGAIIGNAGNLACDQTTGARYGRFYRADVLRFLKIDKQKNVRIGNGDHEVLLPAGVPAGSPYLTNGASLVLIYRVLVPGNPRVAPLKSVVIYDGTYTLSKATGRMEQVIAGFYQAAQTSSNTLITRMTPIVGNGQPDYVENLNVTTAMGPGSFSKPFRGFAGGRWDNPTFNILLKANEPSYSFHVTSDASVCLTWGAFVTSTAVVDTDADGLVDVWETKGLHRNTLGRFANPPQPATFGGCTDYPNETDKCVNLPAMGANPAKKDVFVEIDWLRGNLPDDPLGAAGHEHKPKFEALDMIGRAFAAQNIAVHFDVGNNYQDKNSPYIVPPAALPHQATYPKYPRGGQVIEEADVLCSTLKTKINIAPRSFLGIKGLTGANLPCAFNQPYSVLSFKRGFRSIKDGYPLANLPAHFDNARKEIFHYALFGHALATPFLDADRNPLSVSGIADKPGMDIFITLGLWRSDIAADDKTGSATIQAGTLMHELGHNLGLSHAGLSRTPVCQPKYQSQMNYLYQVRGLTDRDGRPNVDFSRGLYELTPLNEMALSETAGGETPYRMRYYGPPKLPGEGLAKATCDGKPVTIGAVRLESPDLSTPDWNRDGKKEGEFAFDVNYDGEGFYPKGEPQLLADSNDWAHINLQQNGTRLNADGLSLHVGSLDVGSLDIGSLDIGSLDIGSLDIGSLDIGSLDIGSLDIGSLDIGSINGGSLDIGSLDIGSLDIGSLDIGSLDIGSLDIGSLDIGSLDIGERNFVDEVRSGINSTNPTAPLTATRKIDRITLDWGAPALGQIQEYEIYRSDPDHSTPVRIATIAGGKPTLTYDDVVNDFEHAGSKCPVTPNPKTCYNTVYTYYYVAIEKTAGRGDASTTATAEVNHVFVIANDQTKIYGDAEPALGDDEQTRTIYRYRVVTLPAITCQYPGSLESRRNVRVYQLITCSGAATTSDPNTGITYVPDAKTSHYDDGTDHLPGKLTVTKRPITVTAVSNRKTYDGTTTAAAIPVITSSKSPALVNGDSPNFIETYDNKNVGEGKKLTPSGAVIDGNNGNNYDVTFVALNIGTIDPRPVSVTPNAASKTYGDPDPAFTGTLTNFVAADNIIATYSRTAGETVAGSPYTISATLSPADALSNYTITYNTATFLINKRPVSVTPNAASKTYGDPDPAFTGTLTNFVAGDNVTATYSRTAGETVAGSPYTISATLSPVAVLGNYDITYNTAALTINKRPVSVTPNSASKTYGDPDPAFSGTLTNFVPADGVTATYSRTPGETVAGNPYTISAMLSHAGVLGNYDITHKTATFTINQRPVSVTPNAASKTYGDADPPFSGALSNFLPADGVTATYGRTAGETVAGNPHTISATLSPVGVLGNYNITYNTATFTINRRTASVTPNAASKTYGDADPAFSGTLTNFMPADAVTATYSRTAGETVAGSPYTITATLSPAGVLGNYTITYNTAAFTINNRPASVTPNAASKTYGNADPAFTGTLTNFVAADGVTAIYSRTPGETVAGSPYTITATLLPVGVLANYNITYNTAAFTINKRPASVTPNPASKTYGTADPAFTGTLNNFVAADDVTATYSRTAGEAVAGSPYTISATLSPAVVLGNYTITYNTADFTINKAPSVTTVSCGSGPFTYNGSPQEPCTASVIGAGGLNESVLVTYSNNVNAGTATATATATATYGGDANHLGSTGSKTFIINKAGSTTTLSCPASVTYTGAPQMPCSATATGAGGLNQSVPVSYTNNVNAGAATATATFLGGPNHTGSSDSKNFTINQATTTNAITSDNPDPSVVGQPITVTFSITPAIGGTPTGSVSVTDGSASCSATVAAGSCVLTPTTTGAKTLTATYFGDSNFIGSNDTEPHQVSPASTVSITNPTNGATVRASITLTSSVTGPVTIVRYYLDTETNLIGSSSSGPSYPVNWNSISAPNGSHVMFAVATDAAGNTARSANVSFTVNNPDLVPFLNVVLPGDYISSGIGLRDLTQGNITISGIPTGSTIRTAILHWGMLDNGESASLKSLNFNGVSITGTRIGMGPDTCWGRTNSLSYRADVTSLVNGNGTYLLTGLASGGMILRQGATLTVVYENASTPLRNIILLDGNVVMPGQVTSKKIQIPSFSAAGPPTSATTTFIVGDGQAGANETATFTGTAGSATFPGPFSGSDGPLWDTRTFNVSAQISPGTGPADATVTMQGDCLMWVGQAFSVRTTAPGL